MTKQRQHRQQWRLWKHGRRSRVTRILAPLAGSQIQDVANDTE